MACPPLTNLSVNPQIITIDDIDQPRLSTYLTDVGTKVTLTCSQVDWILQPNYSELVCLSGGKWDKSVPKCVQKTADAGVTESPGLSDEQRLIIGITGGVGGVVFIILIVLIASICRIQRKARERKKQQANPYPPRTEVTSVGSLYALDKSFGNDKGYPAYPPSYATRDNDGTDSLYAKRIALPPTSSGLRAYRNPAYLEDTEENHFLQPMARDEFGYPVAKYRENPRDFNSPRSREIPLDATAARRSDEYRYPVSTNRNVSRDPVPEDYGYQGDTGRAYPRTVIAARSLDDVRYGPAPEKSRSEVLDAIARERLDQLQYDRQRFPDLDRTYNAPSRHGPKAAEAVVRAERTLQYVEEHSSGSPTPIYGESRGFADTRQGQPRGQERVSELYSQVQRRSNDNDRGPRRDRELGDYDRLGREEGVRGNPRYSGGPQEPRGHYTTYYDPARNTPAPQDQRLLEQPRYASSVPDHGRDQAPHWRPHTKTHFTGNRVR